jgi:hypothetical protein
MSASHYGDLEGFLVRLAQAKLHYSLGRVRDGFIMVSVAVPGQRWEIEFAQDGEVEAEVFKSDGTIVGSEALARLFREFGDST